MMLLLCTYATHFFVDFDIAEHIYCIWHLVETQIESHRM